MVRYDRDASRAPSSSTIPVRPQYTYTVLRLRTHRPHGRAVVRSPSQRSRSSTLSVLWCCGPLLSSRTALTLSLAKLYYHSHNLCDHARGWGIVPFCFLTPNESFKINLAYARLSFIEVL